MENEKFKRAIEIQNEINEITIFIDYAKTVKEKKIPCQWYFQEYSLYIEERYSRIKSSELLDNYIEDLHKAIDKLKEEFENL